MKPVVGRIGFNDGADAGEFSGKFKLALLQKGWILCPEEMVQGRQVKAAAQAVAWGEGKAKAKVEAEWVDRSPQDRAEIVYARTAQQ